jgi:gliding motility-associated-like protein
MKNKFTILFLIFLFTNSLFSQNLIVNGGFESGGSGVGFVCNGTGYIPVPTPYTGSTVEGNFALATNPNLINTASFISSSDHTSGNGRMLIIDGNTTTGNPRFWKLGNTGTGINTLTIGTTYRFSYWIKSVSSLVTGPSSQANIGVQITGGTATLVSGSTLAPLPALGWRHVIYSFTATATTATIELWNNNTSASGNDFAVDDFVLTKDLMVTYNITDALCASANDGSITVGGIGGTLPYTNYTITGPVTLNNPTGVFAGIPPGIYTVSVTDSTLPTAVTVSMGNAVVGPSLTITPSSSAVCLGSSTTLSATGSSNPYTWTATPSATAGLTTPSVANPTVTPTAAVAHTYTASSSIGACTVTKSITITVNQLPIANFTGNATICPGNTALITFTGTPNSNVTFVNNLGNTYVRAIPASGTITWTTPVLNATTVYTLQNVKISASPFCQTNYPVGTAATVTITVVPNGCATVGTIPGPTSLPLDLTLCTTGECRVLQANISDVPSTTTYTASSIPYCPYPFTDPSYNVVPITGGDDFWSDVINLPFNFCFYGQNYTQCNAGTNGLITFTPRTSGAFCNWPETSVPIANIDTAAGTRMNSIYGVFQDTDMAIPPAAADRQVNWVLQGTYPCRKLIVNFYHLGQWNSTGTNPGLQTSQIVLYEVSNIIEVFVQRRVAGSPWSGSGIIGLKGFNAAQSIAAPGRDTGNWSANSEAWRFTPTGPNVPVVINWFQGATQIATNTPTVTVCPTATTTYTANAVYNVCGVQQTATTSVEIKVNPDVTNAPLNITQCTNTFDLTSNTSVILGSLNPTDYNISYHLTAADAASRSNSILNPNSFVSSGQTIYVSIYVRAFGCTIVKSFNLILSTCGTITPVPDLPPLCETSIGSGTAIFDLTPQTAIALSAVTPSDYAITYYLTQAAANAGVSGTQINPINAFVGTNQTIYIRMQSIANPTTFYTTDFDLIVSALSNAGVDGSVNICDGDTTPINLFNLITGEQSGGSWTQTTGTGGTFNPAVGTFIPTAGARTLTFTYKITGVAPCADDTSLATVNILAQPIAPTASVTVQPTCTTPTGTILVTAPTPAANVTYTLTGTNPVVAAVTQSTATFSNLATGVYNVTTTNTTTGCISTATSLTVDTIPTIAAPSASATAQPTCTTPTGTIEVTTPTGANLEYSVNGASYQANATFIGLTPNNYNVTVKNTTTGCVSTATIVTINAIPTIAAPTASATFQPTCTTTTGTIIVTAPTGANLEYSVNGTTYQASTNFTGLTPNNYNVTVRNTTNGCVSTATPLTINPIPSVAIPTVTIQQPDCTILTGAIQVNSPLGASLEYSIDGIIFQVSPNFTGLVPNNYTITVRNIINGCTNTTAPIAIVNSVNDVIVNINPQPLRSCDPNNDGFVTFDLTQAINSITGGNLGYTVTFHETITDANVNGTTILNPSGYPNINPWTQIIYVRVDSNTTTCFEVVPLQLIINPTPISPVNLNPITVCDQDANPQDGITAVDLTQQESAILAQQTGAASNNYTISYYTSQIDAQQTPTAAISNVTSYLTASDEIWIRIENSATNCFNTGSFQVVVNKPLSLNTPLPLSLCDNDANPNNLYHSFNLTVKDLEITQNLTGYSVSYFPSLLDAQNGTNVILTPTAYQNIFPAVQTLGVVVTSSLGCTSITTLDIRVEPLPTLTPPTIDIEVCDDNQDGFGDFNLNNLVPELLNGITTYTVSFHETLTDEQLDANAIPTSVNYTTIAPLMQILYVRAEDTITGCWSILPITLNVNPSPIAPINLIPITVCDQDSNPQNASTPIDLTQQTAAVLAQQTGAAANYTVEYYSSQLLAQQGTAPIINNTNYIVSNGATIWIRVELIATGCYNIGSFQVVINKPLLLPNSLPPLSLCDVDTNPNNQFHIFDLTQGTTILPLVTGATVAYYPSLALAQAGVLGTEIGTPTTYTNILPGVQTLGVVVTTASGCKSITTLDIRVLPIPTPRTNPPALAPKCDDNLPGDMLELFDLTVNQGYIANGDPNLTFHYFANQADAANNQNELIPATAALVGGNVWIRVENNQVDYQGNNCYVLVEQPLTVNPLPVVQSLAPYRVCDDNTDGIAVFDLTNPQLAIAILGATQLPTNFTISYYLTPAGANPLTNTGEIPLPNSYTNVTPNAQTIYIRVKNNTTGCVNATGVLDLVVEDYAVASGPQTFNQCDSYNDPYDGVELIDLTTYAPDILDGQDPAIFLVSYYTSLADAQAGTNALTLAQAQAYQTDADTDTIWVKVENSSNLITPFCNAITTINITVERNPNPIINTANNVTTICVDFITDQVVRPLTLNSGVTNPGNYTFQWFEGNPTTPIPGATGPSYTVDTPAPAGATRDYTVTVTSASALACQTTSLPFSVIQSGQAVVPAGTIGYTETSAFSSLQTITVNIEGYGAPDYQYSLDDGPRQTSNVFENVSFGTHVIHVWDGKGDIAYSCEELVIPGVKIIDYPHYFTPNGDGIHDTWNIVGLADQPGTRIYIFDRFGKLLKQISSTGAGWDGTYNGSQMPSDDYWFTVDYMEGTMKQFKAHFTLKR